MKAFKKWLRTLSCISTLLFVGSFAACNILLPSNDPVQITAVYEQSTQVYEDTSLDDLRADLTVSLGMSDETMTEIDEYTLSGTLTVGETLSA